MNHTYLFIGLMLVVLVSPVSAVWWWDPSYTPVPINTSLPTPDVTIAPVDTSAYQSLVDNVVSDEVPANETAAAINWTLFGETLVMPYTSMMGSLFFLILFSIPFVGMWVVGEKSYGLLIGGMLFIGFATMAGYVPASYQIPVFAFMALCAVGLIYSLVRGRL